MISFTTFIAISLLITLCAYVMNVANFDNRMFAALLGLYAIAVAILVIG